MTVAPESVEKLPGEYRMDDYGLSYAGIHITLDLWGRSTSTTRT